MVAVYKQPNGFARADSECVITKLNNAPKGDGLDEDTAVALAGGICSGMTTTWVIGFLNGNSASSSTGEFKDYFINLLRFQGSYIHQYKGQKGIKTTKVGMEDYLAPIEDAGISPGVKKTKLEKVSQLASGVLPGGTWASYNVIWAHAVGAGCDGSNYYIMEPNYGLFAYDDQSKFILDFQYLIEARRMRKKKKDSDRIRMFFYEKV